MAHKTNPTSAKTMLEIVKMNNEGFAVIDIAKSKRDLNGQLEALITLYAMFPEQRADAELRARGFFASLQTFTDLAQVTAELKAHWEQETATIRASALPGSPLQSPETPRVL